MDRRADMTPILHELHWLPVVVRVEFKILCIILKLIRHGESAPQYITELISVHESNIRTKSCDGVNPFDPTGYLRSLSCTTLRSRGLQKEPGIVLQLVTNGTFCHQLKCLEIYFVWRPQLLINFHAERVT